MKFENDKRKYLLIVCLFLSVVSVSSFYWKGETPESLFSIILLWFLLPLVGLLQVYRFSKGDYVSIGLITAETEQKDKQKAVVCGAIILIIFPLLFGVAL